MRHEKPALTVLAGVLVLVAGCAKPAAPRDDAQRIKPPTPAPTREPARNEQKARYAARVVPGDAAWVCEMR